MAAGACIMCLKGYYTLIYFSLALDYIDSSGQSHYADYCQIQLNVILSGGFEITRGQMTFPMVL